jgi:hypothetical protein
MKFFIYNLLTIIISGMIVSCDKTDKVDEDKQWVVKAENTTAYDLNLSFFNKSAASDNKTFSIISSQTIDLFSGASGIFELDPISRQLYDSASIEFSDGKTIVFTSLDINDTNNVLFIDNYKNTVVTEYIFEIDSVIYNLSN